jgi:hypothetical protein
VLLVNQPVNKPAFPAYIRFYNKYTAKNEYQIDCSISNQILYYNGGPPQIIFRTTDHLWNIGDSYYVTVDEGVLFSNIIENSTAYLSPKFWTFKVVRPMNGPGSSDS